METNSCSLAFETKSFMGVPGFMVDFIGKELDKEEAQELLYLRLAHIRQESPYLYALMLHYMDEAKENDQDPYLVFLVFLHLYFSFRGHMQGILHKSLVGTD